MRDRGPPFRRKRLSGKWRRQDKELFPGFFTSLPKETSARFSQTLFSLMDIDGNLFLNVLPPVSWPNRHNKLVCSDKNACVCLTLKPQYPKTPALFPQTLFSLMAIDRILYLCSFARAQLVYYFASLLLFTGYTVRLFWNPRLVDGRTTFQLFFLLRALSLGLTATQIKYGPPRDSAHGQFLMRRVDYLHSVGFTIYR